MYDNKIAFKVKKLLSKNKHKSYKTKDIAQIISIKKHQYKILLSTLKIMVKENKINVVGRKYADTGKDIKTYIGTFDAVALIRNHSFAFVKTDVGDFFVSSEDILNALHDDKVLIQAFQDRNGKAYGKIIQIIERKNKKIVGTLQKYRKQHFFVADNVKIHTNIIIESPLQSVAGNKVVIRITKWGDPVRKDLPEGVILEDLGKSGLPEVETLAVIKQFELPLFFPKEIESELDEIKNTIPASEIKRRTDLRSLITFTIDPISAKDYDDAISLQKAEQKWILYVHIADVGHYITPEMKIFREAVKRGNSYYLARKVIPMLPEKLSNNICSLRPLEDKLTLTVKTEFSDTGKIISQEVAETVINSNARFSYEEIDRLFAGKNPEIPDEISAVLFRMKEFSAILSRKMEQKGYLNFELPDTKFIFDENGFPVDLEREKQTESHKMIENFMLVANEFIAGKLSQQTTIYRVHEKPDPEDIKLVADLAKVFDFNFPEHKILQKRFRKLLDSLKKDQHRVFDRKILRFLKKARYSTTNLAHFGLAIDKYTHFTSPIRRLTDLIIHLQIKKISGKKAIDFSAEKLEQFAKTATDKELIADNAERELDLKNKKIFMKKFLGEIFPGIIVGIRSSSLLVELDRFPVIGVVDVKSMRNDHYQFHAYTFRLIGRKTGKCYRFGDKVKIMVSGISDDIYFELMT